MIEDGINILNEGIGEKYLPTHITIIWCQSVQMDSSNLQGQTIL